MSAGICAIKTEFIVQKEQPNENTDNGTTKSNDNHENLEKLDLGGDNNESPCKKIRLSKQEKKKQRQRGQNKSRPAPYKVSNDDKLCRVLTDILVNETKTCTYNNCKYQHDILGYLKNKPKDIGETCYIYQLHGRCPAGVSCRFGSQHISPEGFNLTSPNYNPDRQLSTLNQLNPQLQVQLRKKQYKFEKADKAVKEAERTRNKIDEMDKNVLVEKTENAEITENVEKIEYDVETENDNKTEYDVKIVNNEKTENIEKTELESKIGCITDEDIIALRKSEKKKINWKDKLFLSPLTTVGNLPFRRICKEFGADVTCGEMAVSFPIVSGLGQEWALVKRHETEDLFGVQLCGQKANIVASAAQLLQENCSIDFIDINLGCPIELIYQRGGGSALLRRPGVLETMIKSCVNVLDIPLTVKTRTGVYADKNVAHEFFPKFRDWGVSCATIHGRSREQRYTRTANWEYIEHCAQMVSDDLPVIGNGDILSYQDYLDAKKIAPHISGAMLGRGALIKPWIFTEIKEQKAKDISSSERFDILKKYVNYGLEHWGSDTKGVENTRRFLLEWQSFLYRYVPLGILERPPQKINERPPVYHGRDELETLMASNNCKDWIKISEMLLGPVPDGFTFLPKHKANSYA